MDQQYTPPNILFFSKHCVHSKKFAELLFKLPHVNDKFIKISVDVRNQRLPSFVQSVPTIVVFENGQKAVLSDSKVFSWINQFLEEPSKVELTAYDNQSMSSSLSDGFSFIGTEEGKETEHTFAWMDRLQDTRIGLVADNSENAGPATNSQNMKLNDDQIERYRQERELGVQQAPKPQEKIDFTKMYEQEQGKTSGDQSVISQLQQFRQHQVRRGPTPKNAPDFQSGSFQAGWAGQSQRGGVVQGFGGNRQAVKSPKQQEMESRMDQITSQRAKDTSVFQSRQQGEYMPLQRTDLGRVPPANIRQRIV
jgi:hypothetical protein